MCPEDTNQKNIGLAILISNKARLKARSIPRDKVKHLTMAKIQFNRNI